MNDTDEKTFNTEIEKYEKLNEESINFRANYKILLSNFDRKDINIPNDIEQQINILINKGGLTTKQSLNKYI